MEALDPEEDLVTLLIENEEIDASKKALVTKSGYFRSMFELPMKESNQKRIVIEDAPAATFRFILNQHRECLTEKDVVELMDILFVADRFQFDEDAEKLKCEITDRLKYGDLSETTAWEIYSRFDLLKILKLDKAVQDVLDYMDRNAVQVLEHPSLKEVPESLLKDLLQRDSFAAPESLIFSSVVSYLELNLEADAKSLLDCVRLNLIASEEVEKVLTASSRKIDASGQCGKLMPMRTSRRIGENMNGPPFTSGFQVSEVKVPCSRRGGKSRRYRQPKVDRMKKEYLLPFQIAIYINRIKFKLEMCHPRQRHTQYRFVLEIQTGGQWQRIHDTVRTNKQCTATKRHKASFEESLVSSIRIEVHPADFQIQTLECYLSHNETTARGCVSFMSDYLSDSEISDLDNTSDYSISDIYYDSDDPYGDFYWNQYGDMYGDFGDFYYPESSLSIDDLVDVEAVLMAFDGL